MLSTELKAKNAAPPSAAERFRSTAEAVVHLAHFSADDLLFLSVPGIRTLTADELQIITSKLEQMPLCNETMTLRDVELMVGNIVCLLPFHALPSTSETGLLVKLAGITDLSGITAEKVVRIIEVFKRLLCIRRGLSHSGAVPRALPPSMLPRQPSKKRAPPRPARESTERSNDEDDVLAAVEQLFGRSCRDGFVPPLPLVELTDRFGLDASEYFACCAEDEDTSPFSVVVEDPNGDIAEKQQQPPELHKQISLKQLQDTFQSADAAVVRTFMELGASDPNDPSNSLHKYLHNGHTSLVLPTQAVQDYFRLTDRALLRILDGADCRPNHFALRPRGTLTPSTTTPQNVRLPPTLGFSQFVCVAEYVQQRSTRSVSVFPDKMPRLSLFNALDVEFDHALPLILQPPHSNPVASQISEGLDLILHDDGSVTSDQIPGVEELLIKLSVSFPHNAEVPRLVVPPEPLSLKKTLLRPSIATHAYSQSSFATPPSPPCSRAPSQRTSRIRNNSSWVNSTSHISISPSVAAGRRSAHFGNIVMDCIAPKPVARNSAAPPSPAEPTEEPTDLNGTQQGPSKDDDPESICARSLAVLNGMSFDDLDERSGAVSPAPLALKASVHARYLAQSNQNNKPRTPKVDHNASPRVLKAAPKLPVAQPEAVRRPVVPSSSTPRRRNLRLMLSSSASQQRHHALEEAHQLANAVMRPLPERETDRIVHVSPFRAFRLPCNLNSNVANRRPRRRSPLVVPRQVMDDVLELTSASPCRKEQAKPGTFATTPPAPPVATTTPYSPMTAYTQLPPSLKHVPVDFHSEFMSWHANEIRLLAVP